MSSHLDYVPFEYDDVHVMLNDGNAIHPDRADVDSHGIWCIWDDERPENARLIPWPRVHEVVFNGFGYSQQEEE